jgi:site-specific recombinase XerD
MTNRTLLGPWVRRFLLEHVVGERNLSINTQRSYRDMLTLLIPYVARRLKKSVDRLAVTDLSPKLMRQFLTHLEQDRHCGHSTRNQRLGGLHAFARFVGEHSPEHVQWCAQIRMIPFKRTDQPGITYLDKEEMDALLAAPDRRGAQGQRDYALLFFLYNSGARASEAAQLRIEDVDAHASAVRIIGKGRKHRVCPLWPDTIEHLRDLSKNRAPNEVLFLNRRGESITRFGVHAMVERHAIRATSIAPSLAAKRVSPHVIRHTCACHMLRSGIDINTIRAWLGHVSLTTTNIYAEIDLETKAKALAACSPAEEPKTRWRNQPELMAFLRTL